MAHVVDGPQTHTNLDLEAAAGLDIGSDITQVVDVADGDELLGALVNNTDEIEGLLTEILAHLWEENPENGNGNGEHENKDIPDVADTNNNGTDTQIWKTQSNTSNDTDNVTNPDVVNNVFLDQDIDATGGEGGAANGEADADDGIDNALGNAVVGDDYLADGSASSTADALAIGDLIEQDIAMGFNGQLNQETESIVGGDRSVGGAGGDDSLIAAGDIAARVSNTDTEAMFTQTNTLTDNDTVTDPDVTNNGDATQNVTALGGDTEADDGIDDFGPATIVAGDNASVIGSTSASADAIALGELLTQNIDMGANAQTNAIDLSIVGSDQNITAIGDDDLAQTGLFTAPGNSNTDTDFYARQTNDMKTDGTDADIVRSPDVTNNNSDGNPLTQNISATGGDQTQFSNTNADDGINIDGNVRITATEDSILVSGSSEATADAAAQGDALTQDIDTGANVQRNDIQVSIVGDNENLVTVGDDESVLGVPGAVAGAGSASDTDSVFDVQQTNLLNDVDQVLDPDVLNTQGSEANQTVTADGGDVRSDDGIDLDEGSDLLVQAGDDASISGSTDASANGEAFAELLTQELTTGENIQTNVFGASITGINNNATTIGQDGMFDGPVADAGGGILVDDDVHLGLGTDTIFEISQINELMDADEITTPNVTNNGSLTQVVTANGGDADADDGIDGSGGTSVGTFGALGVEDDLSIFGSASASADAVAVGDLLTQNISMGANVQVNSVEIDIVGGSSTVEMIGEDSLA